MIFQENTKITSNVQIASCFFKLALEATNIASSAKPGQFLHIRITDGSSVFLRRPFSIHRLSHKSQVTSHKSKIKKTCSLRPETCDSIEILYEVVGKGTEILSQKKPGEFLDIIGPLGNGFSILYPTSLILMGGGIGIAPLLFLAEKTKSQYPKSYIQVLIGARTKDKILCEKEFKKLGCNVKISTDDGSRGFKGKVTELLKEILVTGHRSRVTGQKHARCDLLCAVIYACGPREMLEEVAALSKSKRIASFASFEEHLACGIGACLGCAIKTRYGYKKVCSDGPVFNLQEIVF